MFKEMGEDFTDGAVASFFTEVDKDLSGTIDIHEFLDRKAIARLRLRSKQVELFQNFDKDGR